MTKPDSRDARYFQAKRDGYAARSVYKLEDIDRRYGLLRRRQRVVDLGCHPGSWLQYCADKVGKRGRVVGVDLKPPTVALPPWVTTFEADVLALTPADLAGALLGRGPDGAEAEGGDGATGQAGGPGGESGPGGVDQAGGESGPGEGSDEGRQAPRICDLLLSDMAPKTTGVIHTDVARSMALADKALDLAEALLKPGGGVVIKVFQGAGVDELISRLKQGFKLGKAHKPHGSTSTSRETYLVGRGFKAAKG